MEDQSQSLDGYGCICGFTCPDKNTFKTHLLQMGKKERGMHKSKGRVNLATGEITMPNWAARSKEERAQSLYKSKRESQGKIEAPTRITEDAGVATEIRIVPRIFTIDFTPIMRAGRSATVREFGWDDTMPWTDWFDTVIYYFLKEHGIILNTYSVVNSREYAQEYDQEYEEEMEDQN